MQKPLWKAQRLNPGLEGGDALGGFGGAEAEHDTALSRTRRRTKSAHSRSKRRARLCERPLCCRETTSQSLAPLCGGGGAVRSIVRAEKSFVLLQA
eukprot:scaffold112074_cov41-Tisochrysis_lutea.AAC.1